MRYNKHLQTENIDPTKARDAFNRHQKGLDEIQKAMMSLLDKYIKIGKVSNKQIKKDVNDLVMKNKNLDLAPADRKNMADIWYKTISGAGN